MTIYLTPPSGGGGGSVASGTTAAEGTVRLATAVEAQDVNNETLAVTPKGLNAQISASVAGGVTYQGVIAGDDITTLTSATQGDLYKISVASTGVVAGFNWDVNDNLLINANMGGTFDAAKVNKIDSTDSDLATVATSGSYNDLTNKPTNLSQFNNDQNYITSVASASETVVGIIEIATDGEATAAADTDKALVPSNIPHIALSSFDDDLTYLSSVASASTTTAGIIEIADATETSAGTSNALAVSPLGLATEIGNLASTDLSDTAALVRTTDLETVATTGSYNDLSNKPTIPSASTDLTDGADLLKTSDKGTSVGDLVEVVDVGSSVAGISALDGRNLTNLTYANITGTPSLATVATSGDYNDLTNTPGASASGYPVTTLNTANTYNAAVNTAYFSLNAQINDNTFVLPDQANLSDGDVIIFTRRNVGNIILKGFDHQAQNPTQLIEYFGSSTATRTITCNNQQIYVRYESVSPKWYVFDKAQALVATTGDYDDLSNKPTSDDITSDHTGVNYTGALNASITDHLSGIDNALSGLVSGLTYQGNFTLANPPANFDYASKGDFYKVVDSGTYYNQFWAAGDHLIVNNDMGGTINNAKIDKVDNTDVVTTVNGQQGNVNLNGGSLAASYNASNYAGTSGQTIVTHFTGIDDQFGTLGTASTSASTDFLSATGADSLGGDLDTNDHEIVSASNKNVTLRPNGTGIIKLGGNTNPAELRFYCETNDDHYVGIKAPTHSELLGKSSISWRLPIEDASTPGDALVSDGSGNLSFTTISSGGGATSLDGLSDVSIDTNLNHHEGSPLAYSNGSEYIPDYEDISWAVPSQSQYITRTIPTFGKANHYILRMTGGGGNLQRADMYLPDVASYIASGNNLLGKTFTITHRFSQVQNRSFIYAQVTGTNQTFDSDLFTTPTMSLYKGQTLKVEVVQVSSVYKYKVLFIGVTPLDDFKRLRLLQFPSLYVNYNALPETYMNIQNIMIHVQSGTMTLPTQAQSSSLFEHHIAFYNLSGTITLTIPSGVSFIDTTGTTTAGSSTVTLAAVKVHRIVSRTNSTIWNAIE